MKFGSVTIGGKEVASIGNIVSLESIPKRHATAPALAPFSFSATFTLSKSGARELRRIASGRTLPLKKRRRRHSEKRLTVSVGERVLGRIRGSQVIRDMKRSRGSHRRWMEAGRAQA